MSLRTKLGSRVAFTNPERNLLHLLTSPTPEIRAHGRALLLTVLPTPEQLADLIERLAAHDLERQAREEEFLRDRVSETSRVHLAEQERDAFAYVLLQLAGEKDGSALGTRTYLAPLDALRHLERMARVLRREIKTRDLKRRL